MAHGRPSFWERGSDEARAEGAWVEDASDLRGRTRCNRSDRASLFRVAISVARVDWDSAKSLKSTRGCRSIATVDGGADDK